jgi:hypothetical protein
MQCNALAVPNVANATPGKGNPCHAACKPRCLGPRRSRRHAPPLASPHLHLHVHVHLHLHDSHASRASTFTRTAAMAAIYRPTEAIALLRPSFLLPRIQPCTTRRAPVGRAAFASTRTSHATHSSTPNPSPPPPQPPQPQRKSITLTGDTGQVRWSDLSPGEKAVRTTQQSFNLVVVVVGILATVGSPVRPRTRTCTWCREDITKMHTGRRRLLSLRRRLFPRLQNRPLQSCRHPHPRRRPLSSSPWPVKSDCRIRRGFLVAAGP